MTGKKIGSILVLLFLICVNLSGCGGKRIADGFSMAQLNEKLEPVYAEDDFRTTYEVFVYSFFDSDGDGIGDLKGLDQKLDYIGSGDLTDDTSLGCTGIWMLPVFPSPTYHKYDAADYMSIDDQYGTMEDFEKLLSDCHARNIRLIMDLPLNHTSVEHPWFMAAADYLHELPPDWEPSTDYCPYFDYYNFSRQAQNGYAPLEGTNWYYEARFWSGMPDLNLDSGSVRREIADILRFWLGKGVDGFRLDAVTSFYTGNHQANKDFLSWLKDTAEAVDPDVYFVGECWENQAVYADYYRSGIDSFFDFAFAGQDGIIANVVRGSKGAEAYTDALIDEEDLFAQTEADGKGRIVNAPFYTNHDMARSTGYYAYDDGAKTKLAGGLNLLMTGNAFIYYGEELGMKGSGRDENFRAPMYWSDGDDEAGMCRGPEDMENFDMKFPPYSQQLKDESSIYHYYRNAIRIRSSFPVIARGKTKKVPIDGEREVTAFIRSMSEDDRETGSSASAELDDAPVMIMINISEEAKEVDLQGLTGEASDFDRLSAMLTVGKEPALLSDGKLTLPPYGIAVLTQDE